MYVLKRILYPFKFKFKKLWQILAFFYSFPFYPLPQGGLAPGGFNFDAKLLVPLFASAFYFINDIFPYEYLTLHFVYFVIKSCNI